MDGRDLEAYGRVTGAARFEVLHGIAEQIIERLQSVYLVEIDHPAATDTGHDVLAVTRMRPNNPDAASITLELTTFPGVLIRAGHLLTEAFPACGCDACDEQPEELARELNRTVDAIVNGRFEERHGPEGGLSIWDDDRRGGWSRSQVSRSRGPRAQRWAPWPTVRPASAG